MSKSQSYFFGKALICAIFVFALSMPILARSKGCPVRMPEPLLTLYLKSDLVLTAEVSSESAILADGGNTANNHWKQISRTLSPIKLLKGKPDEEILFTRSEYRDNDDQTAEPGISRNLKKGDRALFFLKKDAGSSSYYLADFQAGLKKLEAADLALFELRIEELSSIAASKKGQLKKTTEWLLKLIEEPATRWDGALILSGSFGSLRNEEDNEEESIPAPKAFSFSESSSFRYSPDFARSLTGAQKSRLSDIYFSALNDAISETLKTPDSFYDAGLYSLTSLVENWDKARMANYLASHIQASDASRRNVMYFLMESLNQLLEDDHLDIYSRYYENTFEDGIDGSAETQTDIISEIENKIRNLEIPEGSETETSEAYPEPMGSRADQANIVLEGEKINEVSSNESGMIADLKPIDGNPEKREEAKAGEKAKPSKEKMTTFRELREKILECYMARFNKLASEGFTQND